MARKNGGKSFTPHANWNIPGGIVTLEGTRVSENVIIRHTGKPTPQQRKVNHDNAMRKLRAQQAKMSSAC